MLAQTRFALKAFICIAGIATIFGACPRAVKPDPTAKPCTRHEDCNEVLPCAKEQSGYCEGGRCKYQAKGPPDCECYQGQEQTGQSQCPSGLQICVVAIGKAHWECNPPQCQAGEVRCSGTVPQTCTPERYWKQAEDCQPSGQICQDGRCQPPPVCTDGKKKCPDGAAEFQQCVNGQRAQPTPCGSGLKCCGNECRACAEGETRCVDGKRYQLCSNCEWSSPKACLGNLPCKGNACEECPNDLCGAASRCCKGNTPYCCSCPSKGDFCTVGTESCKRACPDDNGRR